MRHKWKLAAAGTLSLTLALTASYIAPVQAPASTLSELREKQQELQQEQEETRKALEEIKAQQETISEEIRVLDESAALAQQELELVETSLAEANTRLEAAEQELAEATAAKEKHTETFKRRIKFIHEHGSIGYLEIIFGADSFTDMLRRIQYVNDIIEYDNNTLDVLRQAEETIAVKTQEVAEEQEGVQIMYDEQKEKSDALQALLNEKQETMKKYEQDAASYEQQLQEMQQASDEIAYMIAAQGSRSSSSASNYQYTGGQFLWPVPGYYRLSSGYVSRERPIGSGTEFHSGYDIPAPYGTSILAAEAGTVLTAGWVNGYGYTVIIDHGDGISTLYGHNSSLVVSVGEYVSRGQVIARCGSTGNSTGNHCHFEVRINGQHTSPQPFLGV